MGIFEPYRAIGYITSFVPFVVQRRGTDTFVTLSVGKSWQIYNCSKLTLVLGGPQLPKKIRALASYRDFTFAAYGTNVGVFKRAHQVATFSRHEEKVNLLHVVGDHGFSVDIKGNLFIWSFKGVERNIEPLRHILLEEKFTPSCIMHPDTYLNKVIIGSEEGQLQLWNISTKKKLFEFKGWSSSVCCCVGSPALDVVGIGCSDGTIHIHNVRYNVELMSFKHSERGSVTALSFRTDGQCLLASGGSSGVICIWNLEKRKLQTIIREAHDGTIVALHFFAKEPVLMSSSADNSIKVCRRPSWIAINSIGQRCLITYYLPERHGLHFFYGFSFIYMWIFDTSDGDARLLRFRSGHSAPPLCVRFYGNERYILSAGQDRAFRLFSVFQDQQSRELSQRHVTRRAKRLRAQEQEIKLKPIIAFDFAEIHERDWCNVVTCHMNTGQAYVWRLQNFVLGEHILTPSADIQAPVKACTISACGNFAILGTEGGWIERFNLQSGISRGRYVDISEARKYAHDGEVVGVACDATNNSLISAGYNGDVKVWDFKGCGLRSRLNTGQHILKFVYRRSNGLLAIVSEDMVLQLFDVVALRLVRKFVGHTDRVTDLCFSEDGKWLLSSSMDGSLRIWDVILARQIDTIHVDIPVTAISLSPSMDLLATSHVDQNGIYLWVNQAMFSGSSAMDSYASGIQVKNVEMPSIASKDGYVEEKLHSAGNLNTGHESYYAPPFDKQMPNLITLSLLPRSKWQSLTNLDIIKARNKPVEPPKKPEKAPFFLPSVPTLSGQILLQSNAEVSEDEHKGKKRKERNADLSSQFIYLLHSCSETKDFSSFTDYVKGLSPSAIDLELRLLQIVDDDGLETLSQRQSELSSIEILLDYLIHESSCGTDFDFIQAITHLFLKIHGETIRQHSILQDKEKRLLDVQSILWPRIDNMLQKASCIVAFLSNSQL